ncbi:MAG: hypothetical protein V3V24_09860 [Nitrospinaceae bacterium]
MSVWLWWEGTRWFWKWIPTAFLLFGMVFQSVSPMLGELETSKNTEITQAKAQGVLDKLMDAIVGQGRKGFKDTMDILIEKSFAPPVVSNDGNPAPIIALPWLPIIPLVGFPTIYILCLLFVSGLRERVPAIVGAPITEEERLAASLKQSILNRLDMPGMTYRKLASEIGRSHAELNNVVHREENRRRGKTVVGINRMREIEKLMEE